MPKPIINRRAFIRIALLGGIGLGLTYIQKKTIESGTLNFYRWILRGQLQKIRPPAIVGLAKCSSYDDDLVLALHDLWSISEMPDLSGKNILIKSNLIDTGKNNLAPTNPRVVGAAIELLRELKVKNIVVADGSGFLRDTYSIAKSSGLLEVLDAHDIPFIDLNYDELMQIKPRDGWFLNLDKLWLPRHVCEADFILSIPKLKTHHWTGVTLSLKNLIGTIPGSRYGWPKNIVHMNGINPVIIGLYQSFPPVISIIDGIIGMEGNGPLYGEPVQHGLLAVGSDPLAVDIICTQLMGIPLDKIVYLSWATWAGVGQGKRIKTRGVSPDQLQQHYKLPPTI
jgi:uncharacterized protein (DUF362 family)